MKHNKKQVQIRTVSQRKRATLAFELLRSSSKVGSLNNDDDDEDDSKSFVRPLLQLETVTSVLVICSDKQFSFQITTERGCKMAVA